MDWFATLLGLRRRPQTADELHRRPVAARAGHLVLILLDCSGSTLRGQALAQARGAVGALIQAGYRRRVRVGLVQFAGNQARLSLVPQRAPRRWSGGNVAAGGGTPLRRGLDTALQVLRREHRRFPAERQTLVLLTDGRSCDRIDDLRPPCRTLVIDTESGPVPLGRCRRLAAALNGEYLHLDELPIA